MHEVRVPAVGSKALDFELPDSAGVSRRLSEIVAARPVVLVFYRGHWCPFCLRQLTEYQRHFADFEASGAGVVAVSVDEPGRSAALRRRLGLAFPILCDVDRRVARAWELYNPAEMGGVFLPATFVVAPDLTVRFAATERMTRRFGAAEVLAFHRGQGAPSTRALFPGPRQVALAVWNVATAGAQPLPARGSEK